eukprot:269919-Pelagomonas_calceolata.AAC.1
MAVPFTPRKRLKEHKCLFCTWFLNSLPSMVWFVFHFKYAHAPALSFTHTPHTGEALSGLGLVATWQRRAAAAAAWGVS